jgi:hypothetical protein
MNEEELWLRALDQALRNPEVTREGPRRRMLAALAAIAERGLL